MISYDRTGANARKELLGSLANRMQIGEIQLKENGLFTRRGLEFLDGLRGFVWTACCEVDLSVML